MSSIGNLVGDLGAAFGDEGHNSVESLVKNPQLQSRLDAQLTQYDKARDTSSKALDQYIADFLAGNKTASSRAGQEQAVIDRYYNGDVERSLADLRTRKSAASNQALARALGYMTAAQNRDQITRTGTGSSYDRQLALKTGADLNLSNLLDNLNQERSDWNFVQGNQLGLVGKRTGIADALAARDLVPSGAMQANLGWNLDTLNKLLGLDQSNKSYSVKYNPSGSEMAGNIIGDVGNIASDYFSGGFGSMFGGDKSSAPKATTSWMPSTFSGAASAPPTWLSGYGDNFGTYNPVPSLGSGSMWGNMLGGGF